MRDAELIKYLWTHKTQDHPVLSDEELLVERAEGVFVWTKMGKKLLDAFAGLAVVNVGHGRREIAEAMQDQASRLAYYPINRGFSNRPAAELASKLAELTPGDLKYTIFSVSGSEANERSMQLARYYWLQVGQPDRYKVISLEGAYHGATIGTYAICGIPEMVKAYQPFQLAGFPKVRVPYGLRDRGTGTEEELIDECGRGLTDAVVREDPRTVSAVILEPVVSAGGFIIPPLGWLRKVRAVCDELGVLMIADEVITGFGRTGRWFGCDHEDVVPDIMSIAKGVTSGYVPLSASVAHARLAEVFPENATEENVHPNTYSGHPVACAAALANIQILEKENLAENSAVMGTRLRDGLTSALARYPIVGEVRGRGLMVCVDFVQPDGSVNPLDSKLVSSLNLKAWNKGAIVFARGRVLRLAPPLCIERAEVDELVNIVVDSVGELQTEVSAGS